MSCCGKQRVSFHGIVQTPRTAEGTPGAASHPRSVRYSVVHFEYLGTTGMTVLGPITGKRYRFDRHGARVAVELQDRPFLAAVPKLRQVAHP